jgi:hypothetical protein
VVRSNWPWVYVFAALAACGGTKSKPPAGASGAAGTHSAAGEGGSAGTIGVPDGEAGEPSFPMTGGTGAMPAGGQAPMGGMSSAGLPLERYPAAYAAALCQVIQRCWQTFGLSEQESCQSQLERELSEGSFANLSAAVSDGRVTYRPEAAGECLNATASSSCNDGLQIDPANCKSVFTGTLKEGEDCTLDAECAPDRQCVVSDACPGKCGPFPAKGEPCSSSNRCQDGLSCLVGFDSGVCQPPVQLDGMCSAAEPCVSFQYCQGLDRSDPQSTGVCRPRDERYSGAAGAACSIGGDSELCSPELVCVLDEGGNAVSGHCAARVEPGAACRLALPDQCPRGQFCKVSAAEEGAVPEGICTRNPTAGEPCLFAIGANLLPAPCPKGLYCSTQTLRCEQGKHLGEACTESAACYSKHCASDGTCVAPLECE